MRLAFTLVSFKVSNLHPLRDCGFTAQLNTPVTEIAV
jgi:hypothetical protein